MLVPELPKLFEEGQFRVPALHGFGCFELGTGFQPVCQPEQLAIAGQWVAVQVELAQLVQLPQGAGHPGQGVVAQVQVAQAALVVEELVGQLRQVGAVPDLQVHQPGQGVEEVGGQPLCRALFDDQCFERVQGGQVGQLGDFGAAQYQRVNVIWQFGRKITQVGRCAVDFARVALARRRAVGGPSRGRQRAPHD